MVQLIEDKLEDKVEWMKLAFKGFPFMSCRVSRLELHNEFGYLMVTGEYHGLFSDEYRKKAHEIWSGLPENFTEVPHDFSYDPEAGLFIDVTAKQFHDSNQDIMVMSANDPRIALKNDDLRKSTTHHVLQMYAIKHVNGYGITCIAPREQKPEGMID